MEPAKQTGRHGGPLRRAGRRQPAPPLLRQSEPRHVPSFRRLPYPLADDPCHSSVHHSQESCVTSVAGGARDLPAQQVRAGALPLVQRPGFRGCQQSQGLAEHAGLQVALDRGQGPPGAARRVGRQCRRVLAECRCGSQSTTGLRPHAEKSSWAATSSSARRQPVPDARRAGLDRSPGRWLPPMPGIPPAGLGLAPTCRLPSGPAGAGTAPGADLGQARRGRRRSGVRGNPPRMIRTDWLVMVPASGCG
jgi:hypothetical protein